MATAAATKGERAVEITWCTLDSEGKTTGVPKAKCKTSMDTAGELQYYTRDYEGIDPTATHPCPLTWSTTTVPLQRGLP